MWKKVLKPKPKKSSAVGLHKYQVMMAERKQQEEVEKTMCGSCWTKLSEKENENVEMQTCRFHTKCFKCYSCRRVLHEEEGALEYKKTAFCMDCGQKAFKDDLVVDVKKYAKNASTAEKPAFQRRGLQKTASVFVMPEHTHHHHHHPHSSHQPNLPSPSNRPLKTHIAPHKETTPSTSPSQNGPAKNFAVKKTNQTVEKPHPNLKKASTSAIFHTSTSPFVKSNAGNSPLSSNRNFKAKKKISVLDFADNENENPPTTAEQPKEEAPSHKEDTKTPEKKQETPKEEEESSKTPEKEETTPQKESTPENSETPIKHAATPTNTPISVKKVVKTKLPPCSSCKGVLAIEGEKYKCQGCGKLFNRKK